MDLRIDDAEANAIMHAMTKYLATLEGETEKGIVREADSVRSVIEKLRQMPGASGT
jgi:hypothetical protein